MKEHIYILDDHPMIAEGTAQLLMTDERYQVTIGKHYSELYNFIESNPISLLIIDYELQDKTALDLLPYLQKKIPQTPVLVYSMHTEFWIIKLLSHSTQYRIVTCRRSFCNRFDSIYTKPS